MKKISLICIFLISFVSVSFACEDFPSNMTNINLDNQNCPIIEIQEINPERRGIFYTILQICDSCPCIDSYYYFNYANFLKIGDIVYAVLLDIYGNIVNKSEPYIYTEQ